MNQLSSVGFSNIQQLSGYAQYANSALGNFDLTIENTGLNTLTFVAKEYPVSTAKGGVSGYGIIGNFVSVVAKGVKTVSYNVVSKRIGFFGSGNTTANLSISFRNKADLRGAQIDIVATGRRGWGVDDAFNKGDLLKKWGASPDDGSVPPNSAT
jgi:hypothetical protein